MPDLNFPLYNAADSAMSTFRAKYFHADDAGEFPPSTVLAGLLEHARYEGWDFDAALAIARNHGAITSTQIANL